MKNKAAAVSVLAELERIKWTPVEPVSDDEVKTRCPVHDDNNPSCTVSLSKMVFNCHAGSCLAAGDFITFLVAALNKLGVEKATRATVFADLATRYDLEQVKEIDVNVIERYHGDLWEQKHLLKELYRRGVTDSDIRKHRLGYSDGRITIPVKNDGSVYVNIRFYLPGAPEKKFKNAAGRGKPVRLFPVEQMQYDDILLCGGEIKAIVAGRVVNQHGVGAVSPTGGEGKWHADLTRRFKGKRVWICMDVDEAGRKAALLYAAMLKTVASYVSIVELPLDKDKHPKGDINDFVAVEGGDLWRVMQDSKQWSPPNEAPDVGDDEPQDKSLSQTILSENVGRRMRFEAVVSAAVDKPFVVPKRALVLCEKDKDYCHSCGVFPRDDKVFHISPESPAILQMIDVSQEKLEFAVRAALSIPKRCDAVTITVEDHFNAWDVRVNPSLSITNRDTERVMQHAVCIECDADLNTTYKFTGRMYPHPRTQAATLLLAKSETTHDALSKYQPRDLPSLRIFRPEDWSLESLSARLDDIYHDLEVNITRIFMRRDMHLLFDLAYHSALLISVDGKTVKGWSEVLCVGDSSNGKSDCLDYLMRHYKLGEVVPCKNASVAGLLGGLKQIGSQWYMSWGVLPTHDRMLVALEELSGASTQVIASLTDTRSSGIAQISKIEKRRTHSRTRIIAVSNPRGNRKMSSYAFGIEAVRDLIGAPEDIRRFDAVLVVADGEINPKELTKMVRDQQPGSVRHLYTSDLCKELILWAWTRTEKDVVIPPETSKIIARESDKLTDEFSDDVPLIDKGSIRNKLSRLAVALACRTFSTGDTELQCLVRPCHAEYVANFIRRVYSAKSFGYKYYSEAVAMTTKLLDPKMIMAAINASPHPEELRNHVLYADEIDMVDLMDWTGQDKELSQQFMSLLVRKRAVKRRDRSKYIKTPDFIELLKTMDVEKPPDHVKEDKF